MGYDCYDPGLSSIVRPGSRLDSSMSRMVIQSQAFSCSLYILRRMDWMSPAGTDYI